MAALSSLLHAYSAEVTTPDRKSLDSAALMMQPGARVYIASLPGDAPDAQVPVAKRLAQAGLVPVPHIVARNVRGRDALDNTLRRLTSEAGVDRALVLGGDRTDSAGEYNYALQIIRTGLLEKHGIRRIAVGCYPEGHPRIATDVLERALVDKIAAARSVGLEIILISQVCFEAAPIIAFLKRIRSMGIDAPLRIGVAGPASVKTLLKYAAICGVGTSMRALSGRMSIATGLLAQETPEALLRDIAAAQDEHPGLNIMGIHFFTFASLAKSIEWADTMSKA